MCDRATPDDADARVGALARRHRSGQDGRTARAAVPRSPSVIQKKIALLGAPGVGKTSLVRRFVQSLFDDTYLTTIGVKVDKKLLQVGGQDVTLMLWDVAGTEEHFTVPPSYVRGAAGYLLVADGTRPETLEAGSRPRRADAARARRAAGGARAQQDRPGGGVAARRARRRVARWAQPVLKASAKTGQGVEDAFTQLTTAILGRAATQS